MVKDLDFSLKMLILIIDVFKKYVLIYTYDIQNILTNYTIINRNRSGKTSINTSGLEN